MKILTILITIKPTLPLKSHAPYQFDETKSKAATTTTITGKKEGKQNANNVDI